MTIDLMPVYGGVLPNKDEQDVAVFDSAADTYIDYQYNVWVPAFNVVAGQMNELSVEIEGFKDQGYTYSINSLNSSIESGVSATQSQASAAEAASAVVGVAETLAAANGILGLGIGTSRIDDEGFILMVYNPETVAAPPSINEFGEFIVEY